MKMSRKINLGVSVMIAFDRSAITTLVERFPIHGGLSLACGLALVVGLFAGAPWAVADEDEEITGKISAVAPMRSLLARVHAVYPGQVLEVELEREKYSNEKVWVYEVKLLTNRGSVLKLEYDAVNLELLKMKGRPEK